MIENPKTENDRQQKSNKDQFQKSEDSKTKKKSNKDQFQMIEDSKTKSDRQQKSNKDQFQKSEDSKTEIDRDNYMVENDKLKQRNS